MCCIHWECLSWMRLMMSSWGELLGFLAPNTATNANHTAAGCSLSLGSLSRSLTPQTPSSHPFQPLYPFLEALLHSVVSPGEFVCMCVCVCVCVWAMCLHVSKKGNERKETFLVKCAIWTALGGAPWSKSFFLFLPLNWAHLQSPKNCGGTNHLPDKISLSFFYFRYLLCNILQRVFSPLFLVSNRHGLRYLSQSFAATLKARDTGQKSCRKTSFYHCASLTGSAELKDATTLTALNSTAQHQYNYHHDLFHFTPTLTQFGEIYWIFCSMRMLLPQRKSGGCVLRKTEIIVIFMIVT